MFKFMDFIPTDDIMYMADHLSPENKNELAQHLGVKTSYLSPKTISSALLTAIRGNSKYFETFTPTGRLCGIGAVSKSGAVTFVISDGLSRKDKVYLLRHAKECVAEMAKGVEKLYVYSDERNVLARRWYGFAGFKPNGSYLSIDGVKFDYYEHVPVAES